MFGKDPGIIHVDEGQVGQHVLLPLVLLVDLVVPNCQTHTLPCLQFDSQGSIFELMLPLLLTSQLSQSPLVEKIGWLGSCLLYEEEGMCKVELVDAGNGMVETAIVGHHLIVASDRIGQQDVRHLLQVAALMLPDKEQRNALEGVYQGEEEAVDEIFVM